MKMFLVLAVCLCTLSTHSQTAAPAVSNAADGLYVFKSATVAIYNYDTKAEVLSRVFNDIASLNEFNELPYPPQPVFLSAYIQGGVLTICILWNNGKEYSVQEDGHLLVSAKPSDSDKNDVFSQPFSLSPLYKLDVKGNTAIFTFTESFGNSRYTFPLEGKFVITLVKDQSN